MTALGAAADGGLLAEQRLARSGRAAERLAAREAAVELCLVATGCALGRALIHGEDYATSREHLRRMLVQFGERETIVTVRPCSRAEADAAITRACCAFVSWAALRGGK